MTSFGFLKLTIDQQPFAFSDVQIRSCLSKTKRSTSTRDTFRTIVHRSSASDPRDLGTQLHSTSFWSCSLRSGSEVSLHLFSSYSYNIQVLVASIPKALNHVPEFSIEAPWGPDTARAQDGNDTMTLKLAWRTDAGHWEQDIWYAWISASNV